MQTRIRCLEVPEIVASIFECFAGHDYATLRSLVLVNSSFRAEAERVLWKDINIRTPPGLTKCCEILLQENRLARYVRRFTFDEMEDLYRFPSASTSTFPKLRAALVSMDLLEHLHIRFIWHTLTSALLLPHGVSFQLRSFTSNLEWDDHLINFLSKQEKIRFLGSFSDPWRRLPQFPPVFLPKLEDISGPIHLILNLAESRPVSRARIYYGGFGEFSASEHILERVRTLYFHGALASAPLPSSNSFSGVEDLSLSIRGILDVSIASRSLTLKRAYSRFNVNSKNGWNRFPVLRRLRIEFQGISPDMVSPRLTLDLSDGFLDREFVYMVFEMCPALESVSITSVDDEKRVHHEGEWARKGGSWEQLVRVTSFGECRRTDVQDHPFRLLWNPTATFRYDIVKLDVTMSSFQ